jgi:SAM-dependent methyltransferase
MGKTCNAIINCNEEKLLFFEKNGYYIMECKKCSHRFLDIPNVEDHLEKVYSDDYFFGGKDTGYPNYLDQKDIILNYGIKYAKIVAEHTKPGKVLDIGCAAGFILKGFEQGGWNCTGIEPNETMVCYGRKELNLCINTGGLETFETTETFDLINMIQVIGHFYDLDRAMLKVNSLLNANGLVLVESWNMQSTVARLMGKNWPEYSPPSVVNWFSGDTLTQLFDFYGFEVIDQGYPAKRINIKHALSLIEEKTPDFKFKKRLINLLDKKVGKFIIIYPPVDLKWYIFRKKLPCYIN